MNKKKALKRVVVKKGARSSEVDLYLEARPESCRVVLRELRAAILEAAPPEAIETISYGVPAIKDGKVLVWFAGFAHHCSFFPTAAVIEEFKEELQKFATSKGTVRFSLSNPLPIRLIKKMVRARVRRSLLPTPKRR